MAALEREAFPDPWAPDQVAGELALSTTRAWIATGDRAEATAYATFRVVGEEAELVRVAVRPSGRRQGLARRLLDRALSRLAQEGVGVVFLDVREDNAPALALYRRLGFDEVGRRARYYRDGADALLLRLRLERPDP